MSMKKNRTSECLARWYQGDRSALDTLLGRNMPWIHAYVRKRMGPLLRKKAETADYVNDSIIQFLQYGPPVMISDEGHLRALLVRIVENTLREKHDWFTAKRRTISKEQPLPAGTVLDLDPQGVPRKSPSTIVDQQDREAWIRLGMEFLDSDSREVLALRKWDCLSFVDIGKKLGITDNAARMRHNRAVEQLAEIVGTLRRGGLAELAGRSMKEDQVQQGI